MRGIKGFLLVTTSGAPVRLFVVPSGGITGGGVIAAQGRKPTSTYLLYKGHA